MMTNSMMTDDKMDVLDERLVNILLSVGISANLQGYTYLKESIKMVIEDPMTITKVTKVMYPMIAKKYDTTPCRVERAIRHALEVSYNRGKIYNLNLLFGFNIFDKKSSRFLPHSFCSQNSNALHRLYISNRE